MPTGFSFHTVIPLPVQSRRSRCTRADDPRTTDALCGYVPTAYDHLETGTAFCEEPGCRLHDARRQPALVEAQPREPALCERHARPCGNG